MRYAVSAMAAACGLALLGLAFYGQPSLYLQQARIQWDTLIEASPREQTLAELPGPAQTGLAQTGPGQTGPDGRAVVPAPSAAHQADVVTETSAEAAAEQALAAAEAKDRAVPAGSPSVVERAEEASRQQSTPAVATLQTPAEQAPVQASSVPAKPEADPSPSQLAAAKTPADTAPAPLGQLKMDIRPPAPAVTSPKTSPDTAAVPAVSDQAKPDVRPPAPMVAVAKPSPDAGEVPATADQGKLESRPPLPKLAIIRPPADQAAVPAPSEPSKPPSPAKAASVPAAEPPVQVVPERHLATVEPVTPPAPKSAVGRPALVQPRPEAEDAQAVLSRLRQAGPPVQAAQPPPQPQPVQPAQQAQFAPSPVQAPPPPPDPPRRADAYPGLPRLSAAKAALSVGRIEDARRLLQEAQLQLVFRPPDPVTDPPSASRGSSDVAHALEALSASNVPMSRRYIDIAIGDLSGSVTTMPLQTSDMRPSGYAPAYPPR